MAEGAKVTVLALAGPELEDVGRETGAATIAADLSNLDELDGMVARAEAINGPVDILVCMAAICPSGPFQEYTTEQIRKTVTVNMIAHMELVRQVLPSMISRRTGTITTTGSLSSEISMIHLGCYIPSKAGLSRFAFDLQSEVQDYGIRVFTFALGSVKGTPLASKAAEDQVVGFIEARAGGSASSLLRLWPSGWSTCSGATGSGAWWPFRGSLNHCSSSRHCRTVCSIR